MQIMEETNLEGNRGNPIFKSYDLLQEVGYLSTE